MKRIALTVLFSLMIFTPVFAQGGQDENGSGEVVLNYWTWFPSNDQLKETIADFEAENPGIRVKMTVMESLSYQEKIPLALATGEEIDLIGVQPSDFAKGVQDYLVDLEDFMPTVMGDKWLEGYNKELIKKGRALTNGDFKFITILNSGSMFGFYNAALLDELGYDVPATIEEYKEVADALHTKYPEKLAGVFAGMEKWVCNEMMLTILTQQGDYYNRWRYENAPLNSPQYIEALQGIKRYFDTGIFSQDVMDLNYASATEMFTKGDALVYYMGSWDATLLPAELRKSNGIDLENVGLMALPVVEKGGQPAVRAYLDCGIGIVEESEHKEAAAKFLAYVSTGKGVSTLAKQFAGTPGMKEFDLDPSLLSSPEAVEGWNTMLKLMSSAPADRNNASPFTGAVSGPLVQSVINGSLTPDEAAEKMQKEWDTESYN